MKMLAQRLAWSASPTLRLPGLLGFKTLAPDLVPLANGLNALAKLAAVGGVALVGSLSLSESLSVGLSASLVWAALVLIEIGSVGVGLLAVDAVPMLGDDV